MHFSAESLRNQTWVMMKILMIILPTTIFIKPTTSDPRIQESTLICGKNRPPANVSIIPTFVKEMGDLSQILKTKSFATHHLLNSSLPSYGLFQCFHDLSHTDCLLCYAASRTTVPRCLSFTAGRIYLDGCFLRYDSYQFYNETVDPVTDTVNCNSSVGVGGVGAEFEKNLAVSIENVTEIAVKNGGFGVLEVKGVFVLGQCWETVSQDGCRDCLEKAGKQVMKKCLPGKEGRGLNAGCYFRYSTQKFYQDSAQNNNNGSSGVTRSGITVAITLSAMAFLLIIFFAAYAAYQRLSKIKEERCITGHLSPPLARLNFKYEALEKATNYFDLSRKVGQGGAGSVYKGTLPNGKTVAVKRLFYNTKHWVDEFFNEVNLISGIEHKNLVKLLGCSIEGPESLLVYEYVPNRSLDQFLFDEKIQILNWNQRFEIIVGIAEGLAYLHGGSHIRIIHRDIKSSNVLLDENLAPKISDFGLARHFGTDKSHLSTGIAGTLGYMAPEYIVRGQLTEKADVYSFGVLVIEIICGRRNNAFVEDSGSLLQRVWRLHKEGKAEESVDHWLKGEFPVKHASRLLQIGLLCTQALAALRPSMDEVVSMLKDQEDGELPSPNQPPFLNARALNPSTGTSHGLSSSLTSSPMTKLEVSYTTSGYSSTHISECLLRNEDPVDIV